MLVEKFVKSYDSVSHTGQYTIDGRREYFNYNPFASGMVLLKDTRMGLLLLC